MWHISPRFHRGSRRSLIALASLALAALLFAGCQEEPIVEGEVDIRERPEAGDPRGFMLGFSDIPATLSDEAYLESYNLAANYGEVLLIQRVPAWQSFISGSEVSGRLADQAIAERDAARRRGLTLVVALDPFDPTNRARLNMLPDSHAGADLGDPELRQAFVNEATYVARDIRPDYLVLGTDVNVAFERNPAAYATFVEAYLEAYAAVKEVAPDTQVLVSFQYEELLGVMPELPPHAPRWELLEDFDGALDMVGITSYPSFAFEQARRVPTNYYVDLALHTDLPVAFLSVAYASAPGPSGMNSSTPDEQRRFLQRLISDAERLGAPLLIWFAARDLAFAENPPFDIFASIGLQTDEGEPKDAWPVWETTSNRPYDADLAAVARAQLEANPPGPTETPGAAPESDQDPESTETPAAADGDEGEG